MLDVYADIPSKQRAIRKPWQELMTSVHGYIENSSISRRFGTPYLGPKRTNLNSTVSFAGTEREALLPSAASSVRLSPSAAEDRAARLNRKALKKAKLVEKAIREGLLPPGEAGANVAGTLKRKELKKLIRRKTEPAIPSPKAHLDEDEQIFNDGEDGSGGQNL